ncbi:zinc finger protein 271-like [Mytilus edulis]|uniref:zinc finger protein 271-like n=1 Tax=Mytilus edulis TaxID=6550 RepID=UPI0039EFF4B8
MELPYMPFYYPTFPVQEQRPADNMSSQYLHSSGMFFPAPTYIPHVQPTILPKPLTDDYKPQSYNKNELRSSIFSQILGTFPELNNMIGNNQQQKPQLSSCLYDSKATYSERQPYETNIASDIMQEEFDTRCPSSLQQPVSTLHDPVQSPLQCSSTPVSYDRVSDLLEQALSSAATRPKSTQKPKESIVCTYCNKIFSSKPNLKVHLQSHQENKRPHQCNYCGKRFTQKSTLRTHVRIHTGEKPYSCTYCPKSFADFSTFTKHSRIHTGERPYVCPFCGKSFAQSGNMLRHKASHS